jgi:hypothetical protein
MLNLFCKLMFYESVLAYKRLKLLWLHFLMLLPPSVVEFRCALRMERLALRLLRMQHKILAFEQRIQEGCFNGCIDEDNSIAEMMRGLKQDVRMVRLEVASLHGVNRRRLSGARLGRALDKLHEVAESTYLAADRLLWEIEQHDSPYRAAVRSSSGG